MGGFTKPIAEGISTAIERVYTGMEKNAAGKVGIEGLMAMGRSFLNHPKGPEVQAMVEHGLMWRNRITQFTHDPINNFEKTVAKDPQLALAHNYNKDTLAQIHNNLPPNHQARNDLAPLMADPTLHNKTLPDIRNISEHMAQKYGAFKAFGPHSMYLSSILQPMLESGNPVERSKAEAWMSIISQVFRDNQEVARGGAKLKSGGYVGGATNVESSIKAEIERNINRNRKARGLDPLDIDVRSEYKPSNAIERASHKHTMVYLAPNIAIAHISDFMKLPMSVPARAFFQTLLQTSTPHIQAMKDISGIFFHTQHSIYHNDFLYRTGHLSKALGSPDAAAIIHKLYHQPLFNNLRMFQLSTFGTAAYHSAQLWAKQAALKGDTKAIAELEDLGLDSAAIIRRRGNLTDDELSQAIWHFTDQRLLIDRPLDRAMYSGKSPFFRMAFMLHGYVSKEAHFIANQLHKQAMANNYTGIAQFLGVLCGVFPFAAMGIDSLGVLARTASPEQAEDRLKEDWRGLRHPTGMGDFLSTYFGLIGHLGGMGIAQTYFHAAATRHLANALLGPTPGAAVGTAEDLVGGMRTGNKDPFWRDVFKYWSIPYIGPWVSAHEFPSKRR